MSFGLLRGVAIVIAVAGALDPVIPSSRRTQPEVVVLASDPTAEALATQAARELSGRFTVLRAPFSVANAIVIAGARVPEELHETGVPVFAVLPETGGPMVRFEAVEAPAYARIDTRVSVLVRARVTGAAGREVELALRTGDVVIDRAVRDITDDEVRIDVPLTFVPPAAGITHLRLLANLDAAAVPAAVCDLVVDVRTERWPILFYDPRASWNSTFVRRVLEQDPRFAVTSRVMTSRDVSRDAGRPPDRLDRFAMLGEFDAIVVGAPEALSASEVAGLEAFLRRRGGGVLLLFDQAQTGTIDQLAAVAQWRTAPRGAVNVHPSAVGDSANLRASELLWPASLPEGAAALGVTADSTQRPVVWQTAVGAGTLVVSGALDAWRYRDPAVSGFADFWRNRIARLADASPSPLELALTHPVVSPGGVTAVSLGIRDLVLADASSMGTSLRTSVAASLSVPDTAIAVRFWPDGGIGRFRATLRAPAEPGTYRLTASAGGLRADALLTVAEDATLPAHEERDFLRAWAEAHGGAALSSSRLSELPRMIADAIQPAARRVTWHPMRSAWWILPFAFALAAEWLWRRRRGLA